MLRAAAERFAKDGYGRARMVAIARDAGVSRAGLYKHFPSKPDLLRALNVYLIEDWRRWLETCVACRPSAREAVETWLRDGIADSWRTTVAQVVMSEEGQGHLSLDGGATRDALRATRLTLSRILRRGVESGEFRTELDVGPTAHALQALLLGLLRSRVAERPIIELGRRAEIDAVVSIVVQGLLRR